VERGDSAGVATSGVFVEFRSFVEIGLISRMVKIGIYTPTKRGKLLALGEPNTNERKKDDNDHE
jgi:hypothetical protein